MEEQFQQLLVLVRHLADGVLELKRKIEELQERIEKLESHLHRHRVGGFQERD
jgi:ubiquinone biosynthesis protein UbiJ